MGVAGVPYRAESMVQLEVNIWKLRAEARKRVEKDDLVVRDKGTTDPRGLNS